MTEADIQNSIRLAISNGPIRLWRNTVGNYELKDGRRIRAGLATGSPDLIGFKSVYVSPDMIGKRVALFAGVEVKSESGRLHPEQERFLQMLAEAGAISGVARSVEDAKRVMGV